MEYFRAQDSRYRIPTYNSFINSKMKDQATLAPLKTFSFLDNYRTEKEQNHMFASKMFQPRLVGGFVGSKICEQKTVTLNRMSLLGQIFELATSFQPMVKQPKIFPEHWKKVDMTKTFAPVVAPRKGDSPPKAASGTPPTQGSPVEPSPTSVVPSAIAKDMPSAVDSSSCASSEVVLEPCTILCGTTKGCPSVSGTSSISRGSESSWVSEESIEDEPSECRETRKCTNPWLSNIIMCPSDDDSDDDDDSDWDCVDDDDFTSENGEIISEFKWNNGDSLSPIPSPVTRTPPASTPALEDYDSDESEGILIFCGPGYDFDAEEEARERQLAEKRIDDANRRWRDNLDQSRDVPDGKFDRTSQKKVGYINLILTRGCRVTCPYFL